MSILKLEFHVQTGYRELMRDPAVVAEMLDIVQRVKERAGPGFEADIEERSGKRRTPRGSVRTATTAARRRQARDHVLQQALDI